MYQKAENWYLHYSDVLCQYDSAPLHSFRPLWNYLEETFPQGWIDTHMGYPAKSPDLTPYIFF